MAEAAHKQNTYIQPKDKDIPLWRYMSFGRFVDLLSSSQLFFCRTDRFIDQYEGYINSFTNSLIDGLFTEFKNAEEMRKNLKWLLGETKRLSFINCWHMNHSESLSMWETYCSNGEGVAVKSKFENLLHGINDPNLGSMHIRPIRYAEKVEEEVNLANFLNLLNYKRPEYKYENELRVLLFYTQGIDDPNEKDKIIIQAPEFGQKISVDLNILVDEIYVAPNAPEWFYELVKKLTTLTYQKPVLKSAFHR